METEKIKRIEEIYHSALEFAPAERAAFLNDSCGEDKELLGEVESLLAFEDVSEQFFDTPPISIVAEMLFERDEKNDFVGREIGHFKVKKMLGKGGMGDVYLAEDIKLDRRVALKFLPPEFIQNKDRMNRFIREAKSASALNHPNIITIYEINEFEGAHYIAAEFIDGKTLNQAAKSGALSLESALDIAVQIASALDEAHTAGIVHRDIKPDNVMIRANGLVKILDFGIAKLSEKRREEKKAGKREGKNRKSEADLISSLSIHSLFASSPLLTHPGAIIGTADYMSPEQAKGREVDARTDIFSFGIVLYEMLAGNLPFEGETPLEMIGAILKDEPKPFTCEVSPEVENIVFKCLQKRCDERYQTIKDVLIDLKNAKENLAAGEKRTAYSTVRIAPETQNNKALPTNEIVSRNSIFNNRLSAVLGILLISAAAFFGHRYFAADQQIQSIAVMPFVNENGSADVEYLSDGMTETLISSLSQVPNLSIKARSSVFRYKGKDTSAKTIGMELNVQAILSGQVIQRADRIILTVELVDVSTENVIWSEIYTRRQTDLAKLQSEVARDVSGKLELKLSGADEVKIAKSSTADSEAYQAYLKGRYYWNRRTAENLQKAIVQFKAAAEKDPDYALAYVGLADTYALMPLYGDFRPKDYMPNAKQAALKALELDENLAEAHASLGRIINSYDFDWDGAEREFKKSIELKPNYPTARQWYAELLAFRGMHDEALNEISKALELDPLSLTINRMKGNFLSFAERHDEAIVQLNKTIELYPENATVRFSLGDVFAAKGMYSEAVEQYLTAFESSGQSVKEIQKFKTAFEINGWKGFWQEYLENLLEKRQTLLEKDETAYFKNESIALAFAATKNDEKALEYLNKAFDERDPELITIKKSEAYNFLNDDARYRKLIKNIGLPE